MGRVDLGTCQSSPFSHRKEHYNCRHIFPWSLRCCWGEKLQKRDTVAENVFWRGKNLYTLIWAYEGFKSISHTLTQMFSGSLTQTLKDTDPWDLSSLPSINRSHILCSTKSLLLTSLLESQLSPHLHLNNRFVRQAEVCYESHPVSTYFSLIFPTRRGVQERNSCYAGVSFEVQGTHTGHQWQCHCEGLKWQTSQAEGKKDLCNEKHMFWKLLEFLVKTPKALFSRATKWRK